MKRLITTAGLAALGAAGLSPALAQDAMIQQKPWSIGASLRGFYDDNYLTYPKVLRDDERIFDVDREALIESVRELHVGLMRMIHFLVFAIDVVAKGVEVAEAESGLFALEVDGGARRDIEAERILVEAGGVAQGARIRQIVVIVKPPQRRANAPWLLVYHCVLGKSRRNARCTQSRQTSSRD